MNGLFVWSHSFCRSTLAFYEALASSFGVPLKVVAWRNDTAHRERTGFSSQEFPHLDVTFIGNDLGMARQLLREHQSWHQLFGTYQRGGVFRRILMEAARSGCRVGVASESPCNMTPPPLHLLKQMYVDLVLPRLVRRHVLAADFVINLSGDDPTALQRIGWPARKIIPCGYYPPPLPGAAFVERSPRDWENFEILMTGMHEWHRDPLVLVDAMRILVADGIRCRAIVTQHGPLTPAIQRRLVDHALPVQLVGIVSSAELARLYQTCSCFVATGRAEPWGIRVNDALHCGAPLIISDGMGAVKIVRDFRCGRSFRAGDAVSLAEVLRTYATDREEYLQAAHLVREASEACMPRRKAREIAAVIRRMGVGW